MVLAGCAQPNPAYPPPDQFSESAAREMFSDAFFHLHERYIQPVSMEQLAMAGLARLSDVDPGLSIAARGSDVELTGGGTVQSFARPDSHDPRGWARVAAAVVADGRRVSPELRDASAETIYTTVLNGAVRELDGYSRYTDARAAQQSRGAREGFGGLGITIRSDETGTRILQVLPDTPAEGAGLRPEDVILSIDGVPVSSLDRMDILDRLRGPIDSTIELGIRRGSPARDLTVRLVRAFIVPRTVVYQRAGDAAYIRITSFNRRTADELEEAVVTAEDEIGPALAGLILDMRNNPGGLLDQAVHVADLFLADGPIIATRGRHPASNSTFSATRSQLAENVPIVILVNGRSASAAEMLAAALQDRGRAVVVGSTTHGKGSVQNVARMPNGGELVVTWSRMQAPSGFILDGLGVLPGICTSVGDGDPLEQRRGARLDASRAFAEWHRYDRLDPAIARTLRSSHCPARDEERESERILAERIIHDAMLYESALRPWDRVFTASYPGPFGN